MKQNFKKEKMFLLSTSITNSEALSVSKSISEKLVGEGVEGNEFLSNAKASLDDLTVRINRVLERKLKARSMADYDAHCANAVRAMVSLGKGFARLDDPNIQADWAVLKPLFDRFLRKMLKGTLQHKDGEMQAFLTEIEAYAATLERLAPLQKGVEEFRAAYEAFHGKFLEYNELDAETKESSASELNRELVSVINRDLVCYLDYMVKHGATELESVATKVNQLIVDINDKVKERQRLRAKKNGTSTSESLAG